MINEEVIKMLHSSNYEDIIFAFGIMGNDIIDRTLLAEDYWGNSIQDEYCYNIKIRHPKRDELIYIEVK